MGPMGMSKRLLEMQVENAKSYPQGKQKALKDLPNVPERRGKVCAFCCLEEGELGFIVPRFLGQKASIKEETYAKRHALGLIMRC